MTSRRTGIAGSIATMAVSMILVTLALEVGLRVVDRPFKGTEATDEESVARFDPETGWSYIPSHSATRTYGSDGREVSVHFDALGTRVEAEGATRDPERPTILVVGGSFAFGHGVSYEDSLAGQLEGRTGLQVVNAAVQGFGTDQSYVQLGRFIDRFRTRAVVYGFICDHIRRNAWEDRRILLPGRRFPGTKPAFRVSDDGSGVVQIHRPVRAEDLVYSHLYAYVRVIRANRGAPPKAALTLALIRAMKRLVKQRNAELVVVDWEIRGTPALCADDPLRALEGEVELVRPAREQPPEGWATWFIPGDFHPAPESHTHVAGLVAARLRRLGVLSR